MYACMHVFMYACIYIYTYIYIYDIYIYIYIDLSLSLHHDISISQQSHLRLGTGSLEQSLEKIKANPLEKMSTEPSAEPAPAPPEASRFATAPASCETVEVPGLW